MRICDCSSDVCSSVRPPSPKAEFRMAGAGPLASFALAAFFLLLSAAGPAAWVALVGYLGMINGLLAAFNLIPAFPLDGGRMLRAVLWSWKKDLRRATRIAAAGGNAFGILLDRKSTRLNSSH